MTLATTSGPHQNVGMPAVDVRRFIGALVTAQGVAGEDDLVVDQRGAGANMSVDIAAGYAVIGSGGNTNLRGYYGAFNDAPYNLTGFTAAHATNPRIDRVGLRVRDTAYGDAANDIAFVVFTGTATASASVTPGSAGYLLGAPAVTGNTLLLANILIPAAATTITTANIETTAHRIRKVLAPATGGRPVFRKTSQVNIVNSTAEIDLTNSEFWIPGFLMKTNRSLRALLQGEITNSTGGAGTAVVRIKFAGTLLFGEQVTVATSANTRAWRLEFELSNLGSATSNYLTGQFGISAAALAGTGRGDFEGDMGLLSTAGNSAVYPFSSLGPVGADTLTGGLIQVTLQLGTASANYAALLRYAAVEIV